MRVLKHLFDNNRAWAERITRDDQDFFARLSRQQAPRYLWIGCADSRVPANQITGLGPGEMFVHRNVANLVVHTDLNGLCSSMRSTFSRSPTSSCAVTTTAAGSWQRCATIDSASSTTGLRHVQDVAAKHASALDALPAGPARHYRLCELNVMEQVVNVCQSTVVSEAWARGRTLAVHGWICKVTDGLLRNLGVSVTGSEDLRQRGAAE